jgi:hypothetical protein
VGKLTEAYVKLVSPNTDASLSHGYKLHIRSQVLDENLPNIEEIAKKHNLAVDKLKGDLIMVYRPCYIRYSGLNVV